MNFIPSPVYLELLLLSNSEQVLESAGPVLENSYKIGYGWKGENAFVSTRVAFEHVSVKSMRRLPNSKAVSRLDASLGWTKIATNHLSSSCV